MSKIVEAETTKLNVQVTPLYLASLVQLVFDQTISVGEDLEDFAKHGKRKTIVPEDMYMITRKNPQLTEILKKLARDLKKPEKQANEPDEFDDDMDLAAI